MAFGAYVLKQYVVEFIRGTGIRTNGMVNSANTGTSTPFTWTVPHDVTQLVVDGCGGGGGGGAGGSTGGTYQGGGGGGGTGMQALGVTISVRPLSTLTVTIGTGGTGGIVGTGVGDGNYSGSAGNTVITGILPGTSNSTGTFFLAGQNGNIGWADSSTLIHVHGANSGRPNTLASTSAIGGGPGQNGGAAPEPAYFDLGTGIIRGNAGGAGGGSATTGNTGTAGGNGGAAHQGNTRDYGLSGGTGAGGSGNTTGSVTRGGGGGGASGLFGYSGAGGDGGANGGNATGYGSGGGGGGGGASGGNGAPGYLRFTYWSFE